jgi:hypothetical protein
VTINGFSNDLGACQTYSYAVILDHVDRLMKTEFSKLLEHAIQSLWLYPLASVGDCHLDIVVVVILDQLDLKVYHPIFVVKLDSILNNIE